MHSLPVLKHAALAALETENGPGDMAEFFSIIDPQFVPDLVEAAEEGVQAVRQVIGELADHIRRAAPGKEADELLRARQIVGLTTRQLP